MSSREDAPRRRHRWGEALAGGTDDGKAWTGHACEHCGIVAKRTESGATLAWAESFLGSWGTGPIPECKKET